MKKTTIPQSTYGKSAQYVSSKTVRFPITVDVDTCDPAQDHRRAEDDKEPLPGRLDQECSRAVMPCMRQFPACIRQQVQREN